MKKLLAIFCVVPMLLLTGCSDWLEEESYTEAQEASASTQKEGIRTEGWGSNKTAQEDTELQTEAEDTTEDTSQPVEVTGILFESVTLDGSGITESVLGQSKLTMVNVWATYCGPCLSEMPDLGEIAQSYDTSEFQIIGVVSDVAPNSSNEDIDYAADLVTQTGANYTHILANDSIYYAMLTDVDAVPTTFFFDSQGNCLGSVVGSQYREDWESMIHDYLEQVQ